MELHEYPRPDNDTGLGVHWVAGYATAVGLAKIRDYWLPELKELGIKWVKIYNHDGAIDFAELLLMEGIMPIVRIFQPTPNPSRLGLKEIVHVEALIRAGVRYFEFNHEPDRAEEWRSGRVPADGLDLVAENTIANLELILEKGGMPAIPAVANGSRWDLVGKIVQQGRRDLFDGPVWQAIHNYAQNRPLDFPYDIGNQEGAAYTARFFRAIAEEEWGENGWRGRSLAEVNRLRLSRSNPGATLAEDHACWLAYEYFDELNRRHLGRSIPLLSTECGYLVGEDVDPRYPATTPDLHMAQTLEACRIMMGASKRFKPAADYYFCTAFRLFANAKLGSSSSWWEGQAWYSDRWPTGQLPIVHALRAEPKTVRRWQDAGRVGATAAIHGLVLHGHADLGIILVQNGRELQRARLDAQHRYRFDGLLPGRYTLSVANHDVAHTVELTPARDSVVVNFDLRATETAVSNSTVAGKVSGGAGAIVMLLRAGDGEEWVTLARDDGEFRFVDLPAGLYSVRVHPDGSRVDNLRLDGLNEVTVALHAYGWGYTVEQIDPGPHGLANRIHCRVTGHNGISIQAVGPEWESATVKTGTAAELGPHFCVITPVDVGGYMVVARDLPIKGTDEAAIAEARVRVDHKRIPLVDFTYHAPETPVSAQSQITGHVIGGFVAGAQLTVVLTDDGGRRQVTAVNDRGEFQFANLAAGLYSVTLAEYADSRSAARGDTAGVRSDIGLDGSNSVQIELVLPSNAAAEAPREGRSVLVGYAPDAGGRTARLVDAVGNTFVRTADDAGNFRFEHLPAGVYALTVEGGYEQQPLTLDGVAGTEVLFSPVTPVWEADVNQAGAMPGFSSVRVEVEGLSNHPVSLWQADGVDLVQRTGSDARLGECIVEFKPLEPGRYMVRPEDVETVATVDLTGLEAVWVTFRRHDQPVSPHLVRPLAPGQPDIEAPMIDQSSRAHYLLIGAQPTRDVELATLLRFVAETGPTVGASVEDARLADVVTVLGELDEEAEAALIAAGVRIRQFYEVTANA